MKKVVLSFPSGKIKATQLTGRGRQWEIVGEIEVDFEAGKLDSFFNQLSETFKPKRVTVLVPATQTWLGLISSPIDAHLESDDFIQKAKKESGLELSADFFDWKWVETNQEKVWWQCLGVQKQFIEKVLEGLEAAKIKIENIVAEPFAFANLMKDSQPVLLETRDYVVACAGSNVFGWQEKNEKNQLVKLVEQHWGVGLSEFDGKNMESLTGAIFTSTRQSGLKQLSLMPKTETEQAPAESVQKKKGFPVLIMGVVLLVAGGISWWLTRPGDEQISVPPTPPTPGFENIVSEPASQPVEEGVKELAKDISIQVLNGNGRAGAASGGKDLLVENGFINVTTGNAGKYDYATTFVQYKTELAGSINQMVEILGTDYEVELDKTLADSDEYDVVVIIGEE